VSPHVTYAYAPDGVTALKKRQRPPATVRDSDGRYVSGVQQADLPRYGWYPEHRETTMTYGNGIESEPVIDQQAGEAIYRARPVTEPERLQRAKQQRTGMAEMARDQELRQWVVSDATGTMLLYDISPARRADYIGLPAMLDAVDAAYPETAPNTSMITVREINPTRDYQIPHTADQVRLLLQAGMGYLTSVYDQYHRHLDAIEAANTVDDVEAIIIPLEGIV